MPARHVAAVRCWRTAVVASAIALATVACRPAPEASPPPDASPPALAPLPPGVAEALAAATAIPPMPSAAATAPFIARPAAPPPSGEPPLGPGAWSPDGRHVVAYTREVGAPAETTIGRVWIVDAGDLAAAADPAGAHPPPAPSWAVDSGDVVGAVRERTLATWRTDGLLELARAADPVVDATGAVAPSALPTPIAGVPADPASGTQVMGVMAEDWVWRSGGGMAAAVTGSGSVWLVDAATGGAAREISRLVFDTGDEDDGPTSEPDIDVAGNLDDADRADRAAIRPLWLADGRLFVPRPARFGAETASTVVDYPLIDPVTLAIEPATGWAGLPTNPTTPFDGRAFVAPDGRAVVVPRVVVESGGPALAGARLMRVDGAPPRDLQPIGAPVWSPDSSAIAYAEAGALLAYDIASGQTRRLFDGGAREAWWSPDGRKLAVATVDAGLVVVQRDGALAPTRVVDDFDATLPPSWAADGLRIALATRGGDGPAQLVVVDLPTDRPIHHAVP